MPICPKCRVAFLDGEVHQCSRRTFRPLRTLTGVVVGGIVGYVVVLIAFSIPAASSMAGFAFVVGVPIGAATGALIAGRAARR